MHKWKHSWSSTFFSYSHILNWTCFCSSATGEGGLFFIFFDCSGPFCFMVIQFDSTFSISYKILTNYVYYYCILIRLWAVGTSFFHALFSSFPLTPLFLQSSSVSLSYLVLAVLMRECFRNHSCMCSPFHVATVNGTSFFPTAQLHMHKRRSRRDSLAGWWLSNILLLIIIVSLRKQGLVLEADS